MVLQNIALNTSLQHIMSLKNVATVWVIVAYEKMTYQFLLCGRNFYYFENNSKFINGVNLTRIRSSASRNYSCNKNYTQFLKTRAIFIECETFCGPSFVFVGPTGALRTFPDETLNTD